MVTEPGSIDWVLTTTRAVRRRLDLDRTVDLDLVLECLDLALQAPTGGDFQGWRWIVITEPDVKARVREIYLDARTEASGGRRHTPTDGSVDRTMGMAPGHPPRPGARPRPGLHSGTDDAGYHPRTGFRSLRIDLPGGLEPAVGPAESRAGLD